MSDLSNVNSKTPNKVDVLRGVEEKLRTWSAITPEKSTLTVTITCTPAVARCIVQQLRDLRSRPEVDPSVDLSEVRQGLRSKADAVFEARVLRPLGWTLVVTMMVVAIAEQAGVWP